MDLNRPWAEYTFVAFDTETSGAYPIQSDIVEFGAVKYKSGQEIDKLQFLLKPRKAMSDFIIGIHGITNEMVADAPLMQDKVSEIKNFFEGSVLLAHHAPFDLGFIAPEFEKNKIDFPKTVNLCTSLISRKLIHGTKNHKLQTLIPFLGIEQGEAHRAYDDARACLYVGLKSFEKLNSNATLADILKVQEKDLNWNNYLLFSNILNSNMKTIIEACTQNKKVDIQYSGGTKKDETRRIEPEGIVRNPDGDYVVAICQIDRVRKRFYINKIKEAVIVY